ncbi:MAG TPA: pilus assembly protein PilM [Candidatus Hydrogenedentes bacterium]|nr:pilus assembly protein PilM [Candidatus Hydrogenedentota bacterium]
MKRRRVSILQFDERAIAALRVRFTEPGIEVLGYERARGPWPSLEDALKTFVTAHGIGDDVVFTVLPRHEVTARILELPSNSPADIESIVQLNAEEFVPYPLDELVVSHGVLDEGPSGARVLAVFAHHDVVDAHLRLLAGAGLEPQAVYLSTACLASAAIAARGDEDECAVVNLASSAVEAVVLSAGRLAYERGAPTPLDWESEAEAAEAIEKLAAETRVSLDAYERDAARPGKIRRLLVCSDGADVGTACTALGPALGLDVSPARFTERIASRAVAGEKPFSAVLLGAALTAQGRGAVAVDLTPGALLRARRRARTAWTLALCVSLVALFVVGLAGLYVQAARQRADYARELEARISSIEADAERVAAQEARLEVLRRRLSRHDSPLELLARVCETAPASGLNLTLFCYKRGHGITIEGRAVNRTMVTEFAEALRQSGGFPQARDVHSKLISERQREVVEYTIAIDFADETARPRRGRAYE